MMDYVYSGKYDFNKEMNKINYSLIKDTKGDLKSLEMYFDIDDRTFLELAIYKNHKDMKCVIDEYMIRNKFRNKEKIGLLNAMRLFRFLSY